MNQKIYEFYYEFGRRRPQSVYELRIDRTTNQMYYGTVHRLSDGMPTSNRFALNKGEMNKTKVINTYKIVTRVFSESLEQAQAIAIQCMKQYANEWITNLQ